VKARANGVAGQLGFRRVDFVRVVIDGDHRTYEVHGVAHRLPVVRRAPGATVSALAAQGVPVVIREAS